MTLLSCLTSSETIYLCFFFLIFSSAIFLIFSFISNSFLFYSSCFLYRASFYSYYFLLNSSLLFSISYSIILNNSGSSSFGFSTFYPKTYSGSSSFYYLSYSASGLPFFLNTNLYSFFFFGSSYSDYCYSFNFYVCILTLS